VARGGTARPAARGGVGIQAPRPSRARVATAGAALVVCALLAAYPTLDADRFLGLVAIPGALAFGLLAVCLVVGWPLPIGAALLLLAAQYAAALALLDAAVDAGAPLYAAGLLLVGELSYWSLELRAPGREETRVLARRLVLLAALALVAGALGVSVIALTSASVGGGVVWDSVGIAAAVGVLAIIARLARRQSRA
jgi:hypothetical protein